MWWNYLLTLQFIIWYIVLKVDNTMQLVLKVFCSYLTGKLSFSFEHRFKKLICLLSSDHNMQKEKDKPLDLQFWILRFFFKKITLLKTMYEQYNHKLYTLLNGGNGGRALTRTWDSYKNLIFWFLCVVDGWLFSI